VVMEDIWQYDSVVVTGVNGVCCVCVCVCVCVCAMHNEERDGAMQMGIYIHSHYSSKTSTVSAMNDNESIFKFQKKVVGMKRRGR
jgi:hypothetical protein